MFNCLEISLEVIRLLRRLLPALARQDRDLARQIRRAANGMLLQASEARQRVGADQLHLYRVASGSANEVSDALRAAVAWGHLTEAQRAEVEVELDKARAILWRLSHPKPKKAA